MRDLGHHRSNDEPFRGAGRSTSSSAVLAARRRSLSVGASCSDLTQTEALTLTGDVHEVGVEDRRVVDVTVRRQPRG